MRPLTIFTAVIFLSSVLSCNKKSSAPDIPLEQYLVKGVWHVSDLELDAVDKTVDFEGYTFVFNSNGNVTATKESNTANGTWKAGYTGAVNGDPMSSQLYLLIGFSSPAGFSELNATWITNLVSPDEIASYKQNNLSSTLSFSK